jgi:hypothetical protein
MFYINALTLTFPYSKVGNEETVDKLNFAFHKHDFWCAIQSLGIKIDKTVILRVVSHCGRPCQVM